MITLSKRLAALYRFHKKIGRGGWNRYIERYIPCRSIENTQRLIYNYPANFTASRNSCAYLWQLPKLIALATNTNQVLDAWNLYRSKRKPPFLYLKALKRLVDLGGCDTSDWRFTLITSRIYRLRNTIINLPRFFHYLGKLKCALVLEDLGKFTVPKLRYYTPSQLALLAGSYGNCRLHDKYYFRHLSKSFKSVIHKASPGNLIRVAKAYADCAVFDYGLIGAIALQYINLLFSYEENIPDFTDTVQMIKYRNMEFYHIVSNLTIKELESSANPVHISGILSAFSSAKVNDIPLFIAIFKDIQNRFYEYPPQNLSANIKLLNELIPIPTDDELLKYIKKECFDTEFEHVDFKKWVYLYLDMFEPSDLAKTIKKVKKLEKTLVENDANGTSYVNEYKKLEIALIRKLNQMEPEFSPKEYAYLKNLITPNNSQITPAK